MSLNVTTAEGILQAAIGTIRSGGDGRLPALDELPAAIYLTDAEGVVTHYNRACISFAGRRPHVGADRWCVTWKLYTQDGEFLPHDQCPMAVAIREKRLIRGIEAVAERPDGTHVKFRPYPTPLLDEDGDLVGAVNMLLDLNGQTQAHSLRMRAARYRRLVNLMPDQQSMTGLTATAFECEHAALGLERRN